MKYKMNAKKRFVLLCLILLLGTGGFSQNLEFSAENASRQTALRYLRLAKNYAASSSWQNALLAARAGNDYDKSVADLWYLMALSGYNSGATRKEVVPLLQNALSGSEWVDYNRSSARIFYADLLCSTGRSLEALRILDEKPFIYSADAEYVRIKAYYQMGSPDAVEKAREKVDVSRRIYPADIRFVHLFFAYEYKIMYSRNNAAGVFDYIPLSGVARRTADYFISRVPEYDKQDPELEVYAALFASDENKSRLLRAFDARGFKSPLYAAAALDDGILGDEDALNYFLDFMDSEKGVDLFELEHFAQSLKGEEAKRKLRSYLNAYSGTISSDTNRVLENNLFVTYSRGRPQKIVYDADNDGGNDWEAELDFGLVKSAHFEDKKIDVYYGTYPSPVRIVFEQVPGDDDRMTVFNLADETVDADIFRISADAFLSNAGVSDEFYIVDESSLWSGPTLFDVDKLLLSISSMEKPSRERDGAFIRFSMLNGEPYAADYLIPDESGNERLYAHTQWTKPLVRNVDRDGDGIFETTEIYFENDGSFTASKEDLDAASQNIWGAPVPNPGIYLKMVQIDRNSDTEVDFSEEYMTAGGRRTTWDLDYDGRWDLRHTLLPQEAADGGGSSPRTEITEVFAFNAKKEKVPVVITSVSGEVSGVLLDGQEVPVTKGKHRGFYWIGDAGNDGQERNVIGQMAGTVQGFVRQFDEKDFFLQAVIVGENTYARVLEKSEELKEVEKNE